MDTVFNDGLLSLKEPVLAEDGEVHRFFHCQRWVIKAKDSAEECGIQATDLDQNVLAMFPIILFQALTRCVGLTCDNNLNIFKIE